MLGLCALAAPAAAQAGLVLKHKKISEVSGAFPGGLDPNDQMGRAVISAGDIDGDGNVELVSGAIGDDDGGTAGIDSDTGALWVHFLQTSGGLRSNQKISMTSGNLGVQLDNRDQFGRALAPLGDFDGDGIPDIAAGACRDDDGGVNRGAFYLLYLNRDGTVKDRRKISDTAGNFTGVLEDLDEFGRSIANLGDLDQDGVIDLAVGAIGDDDGGVDMKGAVWILFMNADGTVKREQKISDTAGNFQGILGGGDIFGFAAECLGDVNGDGIPDLAVGTPKDDDGGVRKGAVWILFLKRDGTVLGHKKISDVANGYGLQEGNEFGSSMAGLGDLDGDGVPDMAVGAPLDDGLLDDQGAVWINFLKTDGGVKSKLKINDISGNFTGNLADGDWFGMALATMPDLDGDGRIELAVGARFDDDGGLNTGSNWILFLDGMQNVPPTPAFVLDGASGLAPLNVLCDDRSSAGAKNWSWDFGDGAGSLQRDPAHIYTQAGAYDVTLTVSGPGGSASLTVPDAVLAQLPAQALVRNGSGVNDACYATSELPILGTTWHATVDASNHPGAGMTFIYGSSAAFSQVTPFGEVLVRLSSKGGLRLFTLAAGSGGGVAQHALAIPVDVSLVGLTAYTQALILGGGLELCNAIDLTLGY
ncbi:MAG: PKD domain-containing protein [Planctomycetota bacterium]